MGKGSWGGIEGTCWVLLEWCFGYFNCSLEHWEFEGWDQGGWVVKLAWRFLVRDGSSSLFVSELKMIERLCGIAFTHQWLASTLHENPVKKPWGEE